MNITISFHAYGVTTVSLRLYRFKKNIISALRIYNAQSYSSYFARSKCLNVRTLLAPLRFSPLKISLDTPMLATLILLNALGEK